MKNLIYLAAIILLPALVSCEKSKTVTDLVDFEELVVDENGLWNGENGEEGFTSGNIFFPNNYNNEYSSWSGFAYSDHTDVITGDYSNQYSSIAGQGDELSGKYATFFSWTSDTIVFEIPEKVTSLSLSNSTYAYRTMETGNMFAKKFGGEDGTDEDWFTVSISGIDKDGNEVAVMTVYLADFRSSESSKDYILDNWVNIDLSEMGYVKKLSFIVGSSDVGDYGINTPTYFCIDNIKGELLQLK